MLDIREQTGNSWPTSVMPLNFDSKGYSDESFINWKHRISPELNHIHDEILEQWIHRHWSYSIATFVPLSNLKWKEEKWAPTKFISEVGTLYNDELNAKFDYKTFQGVNGIKLPTASALDAGKWDFAPILLSTPNGFVDIFGSKRDSKYLLIEGHQRRRYLNALITRGDRLIDQRVFILSSPITDKIL